MQPNTSRNLVHIALFAALTCALTIFPAIPTPVIAGSYIHLGDAVILISVYFMGKKSIISAAIGSALADILVPGAILYAPATLLIKAAMAAIAYLIISRKENSFLFFAVAALLAESTMILGYFLYEWTLFGAALAGASVISGLIQAGGAFIFASSIYFLLKDTPLKQYFQKF